MTYEISDMRVDDYEAVIAFWRTIAGLGLDAHADSRPEIEKYLDRNPGMSFVARESGTVVGAVLCGHDGRRGYLHHLAVAPAHRGNGIGGALVERCMAVLCSLGIGKCNIFVFTHNEDGQAFWRKVGWNGRSDLLVMQRSLSITGAPVQ